MSTSLDNERITTETLLKVWNDGLQGRSKLVDLRAPRVFFDDNLCGIYGPSSDLIGVADEERLLVVRDLLHRLLEAAASPETHFEIIDKVLTNECVVYWDETLAARPTMDDSVRLLDRLPRIPPMIDLSYELWTKIPPSSLQLYANPDAGVEVHRNHDLTKFIWDKLQVVTTFSSVTLKMAMLFTTCADARYDVAVCAHRFLNLMAELMDMLTMKQEPSGDLTSRMSKEIVKIYLWSSWTRCLLLFFWHVLRYQLKVGNDKDWNLLLALRGTSLFMSPSIRATFYGWNNQRVPYMCSWAFELLKEDRAALGQDFRYFHQAYARLHKNKAPRCLFESDMACDGGHPLACGRFRDERLVAEEQSVHDHCKGDCKRLTWSRKSYVAISGPVAVAFSYRHHRVQYVKATERTLAISHVWSHGHGGRPHTGINTCLHKRFVKIAKSHGCNSYWIDTLCIPDEHIIRKAAISCINWIFAESKIVLVLDKDLMAIDVSTPSVTLLESVLATFLVCDWNVRAWTMLEAMKGCHNLHILCKNNRTISLRDSLREVHGNGRIDLSVLFLAAQHLLPGSTDPFRRPTSRVSLENAGGILSHRHATRPGDDIVIWSLMSHRQVFDNSKDMWKALIGSSINSAYLMSSAPRLKNVSGFSWAPATPYIRRTYTETDQQSLFVFTVYDGAESQRAVITPAGLRGLWLVYDYRDEDSVRYADGPVTANVLNDNGDREIRTIGNHRILNHCWGLARHLKEAYEHVILIQPMSSGGQGIYRAYSDRGETHGSVFAICGSNDRVVWQWEDINAWPRAIEKPEMKVDELMIA
ncbi:MAG: hypothetical protein Q9169_006232 [Polycauliona sp. 2 TL-2023]